MAGSRGVPLKDAPRSKLLGLANEAISLRWRASTACKDAEKERRSRLKSDAQVAGLQQSLSSAKQEVGSLWRKLEAAHGVMEDLKQLLEREKSKFRKERAMRCEAALGCVCWGGGGGTREISAADAGRASGGSSGGRAGDGGPMVAVRRQGARRRKAIVATVTVSPSVTVGIMLPTLVDSRARQGFWWAVLSHLPSGFLGQLLGGGHAPAAATQVAPWREETMTAPSTCKDEEGLVAGSSGSAHGGTAARPSEGGDTATDGAGIPGEGDGDGEGSGAGDFSAAMTQTLQDALPTRGVISWRVSDLDSTPEPSGLPLATGSDEEGLVAGSSGSVHEGIPGVPHDV